MLCCGCSIKSWCWRLVYSAESSSAVWLQACTVVNHPRSGPTGECHDVKELAEAARALSGPLATDVSAMEARVTELSSFAVVVKAEIGTADASAAEALQGVAASEEQWVAEVRARAESLRRDIQRIHDDKVQMVLQLMVWGSDRVGGTHCDRLLSVVDRDMNVTCIGLCV